MSHLRRRFAWASATCLVLSATLVAAAPQKGDRDKDQKDSKTEDAKKPKVTLKAQPVIAMAPARVVLTAELNGGDNDYEDFYCPTIEWDWGDGTQSESTTDCPPYEAGRSEIKRRFTVEHRFQRPGAFRVTFKLKRRDKATGLASVSLQVRPGLRDPGQ